MKRATSRISARFAVVAMGGLGASLAANGGCSSGYGSLPSAQHIQVDFEPGATLPTLASPRAISFTTPDVYTVKISARTPDGAVDPTFNGYVRLSSKPGTVTQVAGPNTNGRNVLLANGVADNVAVSVLASFGDTRIWAEDLGYIPADPARKPPPQCSDGIDNDGDGLIDYPADPGCYVANDDTENGGTYAGGTSPTIYYELPRIADVRGVRQGGTGTSFPHEQVTMDTGYRGTNQWTFGAHDCLDSTCGGVVVTRVSSAGFFVTDLSDNDPAGGRGWGSVYAYNFSAPPNMRQCDRLRTFGGTSSDFYGFTEINYPTWELEEWDPSQRPCLIPPPHTLAPSCTGRSDCIAIPDTTGMLKVAAALVRVETANGIQIHVGAHFGSLDAQPPGYVPDDTHSNCDLNHDGKIDRTNGSNELTCSNNCDGDTECSEYSNYLSQNQFKLSVNLVDGNGNVIPNGTVAVQANGSTDAQFNPVQVKGQVLRSFTGTLTYFSGGSQFTIEARCADDIVVDPNGTPVPADTACVHARTILDNSAGSN
jgi:hypothetical protein